MLEVMPRCSKVVIANRVFCRWVGNDCFFGFLLEGAYRFSPSKLSVGLLSFPVAIVIPFFEASEQTIV